MINSWETDITKVSQHVFTGRWVPSLAPDRRRSQCRSWMGNGSMLVPGLLNIVLRDIYDLFDLAWVISKSSSKGAHLLAIWLGNRRASWLEGNFITLLLSCPRAVAEDSGLFEARGIVWGKCRSECISQCGSEKGAELSGSVNLPQALTRAVTCGWSFLDACSVGSEKGRFLPRESPVGGRWARLPCVDRSRNHVGLW